MVRGRRLARRCIAPLCARTSGPTARSPTLMYLIPGRTRALRWRVSGRGATSFRRRRDRRAQPFLATSRDGRRGGIARVRAAGRGRLFVLSAQLPQRGASPWPARAHRPPGGRCVRGGGRAGLAIRAFGRQSRLSRPSLARAFGAAASRAAHQVLLRRDGRPPFGSSGIGGRRAPSETAQIRQFLLPRAEPARLPAGRDGDYAWRMRIIIPRTCMCRTATRLPARLLALHSGGLPPWVKRET